MKRNTAIRLGILLSVLQTAIPAWSAWEIAPFYGGKMGGSLDVKNSIYDKVLFNDSASFGLAVGADVSTEGSVEVLWSHQDTTLRGRLQATGMKEDITTMGVDQVFFNGLYLMGHEPLRPFVLAGLGATRFNPYGNYDSLTRFSWALGGGLKYYLAKNWGLRLDA